MAENTPLTRYHYSETTEIFFQVQSSDTVPSYLLDAELSDETIGRALSSPLFIQGREEPADRRQAYHSFEERLLPTQYLSVCRVRTRRPVHELSSLSSRSRKKPRRDSGNERIRILLERQKEQILADVRAEIHKFEFQADSDRRSIQELNGIIEKLITLLHVMNNFNEINNFCMNNYQNKIGIFVKLMRKVSMRWKN